MTRGSIKRELRKKRKRKATFKEFPILLRHEARQMAPAHFNNVRRLLALNIFRRIVRRSPVDRGTYRASHNVSVGRISRKTPKRGKKHVSGAGATTQEEMRALRGLRHLREVDTRSSIFLSTNLPYSGVIEHGEYPDPPKRGSYVRRGRPGAPGWFVLSRGGFSRQAPRGVYGISTRESVRELAAGGGTR